MRFEYKNQGQAKMNAEVSRYLIYKSPLYKISRICTIVPLLLTMCVFIYESSSISYDKSIYLKFLGIEIAFILACVLLRIYSKRKSKSIIKKRYVDADSVHTVIIENDIFTRKNEFTLWQLPLKEIKNIDLLDNEVVIYFSKRRPIFIPKASLPVSTYEFIEIFKNKNSNIKVTDYDKKMKRSKLICIGIIFLTLGLSIVTCSFIKKDGNNNRISFSHLITQDELEPANNGKSYRYTNKSLGMNIYFPSKWNGHYGINEVNDQIEVYYLADGDIESEPNLIFRIEKGMDNEDRDLNFMRYISVHNTMYSMYGARRGTKFYGSDAEYEEYKDMFHHASNLNIN